MTNNGSRSSLVVGLALIGLGALFLLQQFFDFNFWGTLWPLLVLGAGALLFIIALSGGRDSAPMFVPASVVSMVGVILFTANVTDRWEIWAYAWTLIPVGVGLGLSLHGWRTANAELTRRGTQTIQAGLVMLLIFGAFFELVIFGPERVGRWAAPVLQIAVGLFLLGRGLLRGRRVPGAQTAIQEDKPSGPH